MTAARYRHAPGLDATQELVLSERHDRNGKLYYFAFRGTEKFFMTRDGSRPGVWRLYSQSLRPGPDTEPVHGPNGGRIITRADEIPIAPGFVSALAPTPREEKL